MAFPLSSQIFTNGNAAAYSDTVVAGTFTGDGGRLANITGANVTGTVSSAVTAGTVTANAQPNITSVGTLSSLAVTGNISGGNIISAGVFQSATITSSSIAIPYSNTVPHLANVITLNGNTLWRSNSNIAANIPFAVGNTANTWSMVQQWTKTSQAWYVDPVNGLDTNDGSQVSPLRTIARGLTFLGGSGRTLILYPGTYTEDLTITNPNINMVGISLGSGVLLSGNVTLNLTGSPSSSQRFNLMRCSNVTVSGTGGGYYFDTCQLDQLTHNSTGYVEFIDCESEVGLVTITGAGSMGAFQGNLRRLTVANAAAVATIQDVLFAGANIIVTAGTTLINNCIIVAPTANANVITASAGSAVYVNYTGMTTSTGAAARVSLGGFYSFTGAIVDTANSVLGTNLNTVQVTDSLNVLNLANVAALTSRSTVTATGNITTATGNVTGGNLVTSGRVVATGNVSGNFILGNGAFLTGLAATYGNANVSTYLASGTNSANIITTANVSGGNVIGTALSTGNITVNANVISSTDDTIFIDPAGGAGALSGNVVIQGNLTVNGTTTTVNSNVVSINDLVFEVANNASTASLANGGGFGVGPLTGPYATLLYASVANVWQTNLPLVAPQLGNVSTYLYGDGSNITGLPAGYTDSDVSTYLASGTNTANITTTGNVAGAFIIGDGSQLTNLPVQTGTYGDANVTTLLEGGTVATNIITTANMDATLFNAVTSGVSVGTVQAAATKFGTTFNITSASGANDGDNGVNINITAGDANESGGTPAVGGGIFIDGGLGTTPGDVNIGTLGSSNITMGVAGRVISVSTDILSGTSINAPVFTNQGSNVAVRANTESWAFGIDGNLTLPGNTFAVNYANGTPVTFSSSSIGTMTSGATITPAATNTQYNVTALAESATVAAPSGAAVDGAKLTIRILDNGTARALTWNAIYQVIGTTLPTTTVAGKYAYVGCIYNSQSSKWDVVSVAQEA